MLGLRHLKVIVFIVGVLVVGFGGYAAFQVQEAKASHIKSPKCVLLAGHHVTGALIGGATLPTGNYSYTYTTCSNCSITLNTYHITEEVKDYIATTFFYNHVWGGYCHSHTKYTPIYNKPAYYRVIPCGG